MVRKPAKRKVRKSSTAILEQFWQLVEDNPQAALAIAMAIGALISEATRSRGNVKNLLTKPMHKAAKLLPQMVAELNPKVPDAVKILAGPALQAAIATYGTRDAERKAARAVKTTQRRNATR